MELKYCAYPYVPKKDPQAVPQYSINLDLEPGKRWSQICSASANPRQVSVLNYLINTVQALLPGHGKALNDLGVFLNDAFPSEYAAEIVGCSKAAGGNVSVGWLSLFNVGYEASDACTSMIVTGSDGLPLHGRNLDFFSGAGFTGSLNDLSIQVDFQSGGKTQFTTSTFPGFAGSLSIMKCGVASVTIDTGFQKAGIEFLFYEFLRALEEGDASMVSFLARSSVQTGNSWAETVNTLSTTNLVADVYYTVAGPQKGQGVVLARLPEGVRVWHLNETAGGPANNAAYIAPSGPFILETSK